jgi:hypothetical protein
MGHLLARFVLTNVYSRLMRRVKRRCLVGANRILSLRLWASASGSSAKRLA